MTKSLLNLLLILICTASLTAQNITGTIINAETGERLSFATIEVNGEGLISNSEGNFTLSEKNSDEDNILNVSFLGYYNTNISVGELKKTGNIIRMKPGAFELENLNISNVNKDVESIMAAVKSNLSKNYSYTGGKPTKNTIFYRKSSVFKPKQLEVELDKSTGFKKKELKEANRELQEFSASLLSHPPQEFTEMLCNYYTATKQIKEKPTVIPKFEVVKAIKFKDEKRSVAVDELQATAFGILYRHIDSTKHYRIKSGLFGTRDTILSPEKRKKDKQRKENNKLSSAHATVMTFLYQNSLLYKRFDFISKHELYNYSYIKTVQLNDDEYAYVINFSPRKRKAKYTGTLYISENDYAVIRVDYTLAEGKNLSSMNLKFLLGVKQADNRSKGTLIFKKRPNEASYYLQYASEETGQYIYINRPLKFIEITDEKKDVAAFDLKIETNIYDKEEYFNTLKTEITDVEFDNVKKTEFDYLLLQQYDPDIWKEYSIIEPLEEMKQFKTYD